MKPRSALVIAAGLVLGILAATISVNAQQPGRVHRVGALWGPSRDAAEPLVQALENGFRARGYELGRTLIIEHRFTDFRPDQLAVLAAELAHLNVDVFVTGVDRNARAIQQATTKIPIVMAVAEDPVGAGLVKSLARPGGNVTGVTVVAGPEIFGKNLELLTQGLPKGAPIAILFNPTSPINARYLKAIQESAQKLGVKLLPAGVRNAEDFDGALGLMRKARA